ncbi:MAG TPA: FHA domain-containing protein [Polyangiaceae bacterium]|nr:FHA domain-containing protein [Polyangiaceae bacterium]
MPFRLRHLQHNLELGVGEFLIGRSAECQLALDDPLVSRKHALLAVTVNSVTVKDLGSRNGVVVNGTKIDTSRILLDGDRIVIGSQAMTLIAWKPKGEDPSVIARRRTGTQTLSSVVPSHVAERLSVPAPRESVMRVDSLPLLSTLADKAFALGRPDDAERILTSLMGEVLKKAQAGDALAQETVDQAAQYGVRLASATGKGSWVDYVVALYSATRRPCPAPLVDELHAVMRKTGAVDVPAFRAYVEILREESAGFGPAERFLLQRIEGLERLAALK